MLLRRSIQLNGRLMALSLRQYLCSKSSFDVSTFVDRFLNEVKHLPAATDPVLSSRALRKLVKSKELMFTDMVENPEKFFLAHRLLASVGLGGFGVRFTVQFNLFAGSILGLGGPEQLKQLEVIQESGQLGCFLLTESQAGVLSGLIVETTAEWDKDTQEFILHTPSDKAAKNWISQGYTAELGVVIADLRVDGISHGPHAFFMHLRDGEEGSLLPGIRIIDMGTKTIANDLDNARVWFDQVRLPRSALLNKFADVENNLYVQTTNEKMRIEVIGQRLLTGRMAIAEAALVSCRVLHMKTESYARQKLCNGLAGEKSLYAMPQLRSVFDTSYSELDRMIDFVGAIEQRLNVCLRNGSIPDAELVDAISVCKVQAIRVATERAHTLRQEVGSYALMYGTGFELMDMLLCCKFAEGDSRILQLKLMSNRLKRLQKEGIWSLLDMSNIQENWTALQLARKLSAGKGNLAQMDKLFTEHWEGIYRLSEMVERRCVNSTKGVPFIEPIVERLVAAETTFDRDWKQKLIHKQRADCARK